jgi:hypothetical protein
MTITQTVDIPANHRLTVEVPREIPAGRAVLAFTPVPVKKATDQGADIAFKSADGGKSPRSYSDALLAILSQPTPRADALSGILSDLGDITLEQIRDERLARQLK